MQARCQCVVQANDDSDSMFSGTQTLLSTCLLKPATHPYKLQPWHIQNWSHSSSSPPSYSPFPDPFLGTQHHQPHVPQAIHLIANVNLSLSDVL